MQNHLYYEYVCLKSEEKDTAKDREAREEYHQEHISYLLNPIPPLPRLNSPIAQQGVKRDNEGLEKELTSREAQLIQLENQQAKRREKQQHAEVLIVEEESLECLGGTWLLGFEGALGLSEGLLGLVALLQVVRYEVLIGHVSSCHC